MPNDDNAFISTRDVPVAAAAPARRSLLKRPITWIVLLLIIGGAAGYGTYWWTTARFIESTDNAYLRADQVAVAPRVSGYVAEVLVADDQSVSAGQNLVRIDPATYSATLARQLADQNTRTADVVVAQSQLQQQLASVDEAQARLAGDVADARFAARQVDRYRGLAATGAETPEKLAQMINQRDKADAMVHTDSAALLAAQRQVTTAQAQIEQARAQVTAAQATADEAKLDVGNTLVTASIAGRVGDKTVRVGQYVQPGTRMLSIVPVQNIYVVANFKETQLARMSIGQHASVSIDALDGRSVDAVIESFAPGTGAQFSLLPPENATGNFTKIVQRVPVRLRLQADTATLARLVPGLSATVEVDTNQPVQNMAARP